MSKESKCLLWWLKKKTLSCFREKDAAALALRERALLGWTGPPAPEPGLWPPSAQNQRSTLGIRSELKVRVRVNRSWFTLWWAPLFPQPVAYEMAKKSFIFSSSKWKFDAEQWMIGPAKGPGWEPFLQFMISVSNPVNHLFSVLWSLALARGTVRARPSAPPHLL